MRLHDGPGGLHDAVQFGEALRRTLVATGYKQAVLASLLRVNPSTVSRWVAGKTLPDANQIRAIDKLLGSNLSDGEAPSKPRTQLFVSSPMLGFAAENFARNEHAVREVVSRIESLSNAVFWPGVAVPTLRDVQEPSIATEENLRELYAADAFLYVQFEEIQHPSSALIELGIALGLQKRVTLLLGESVRPPYMLSQGFEGVASRLPFTPDVRLYHVRDSAEACSLIERTGLMLFGLEGRR